MSWGTYYKHEGYLSHIGKDELYSKLDELKSVNDMIWREILAYMSATPPATIKDAEGYDIDYPEYIANKVRSYRQDIEENNELIARINECIEALEDDPNNVSEG